MPRRYWLLKSEPEVFSIDDLKKAPSRRTVWEGVRNYQARNLLRDELQKGDGVLYYHSNAKPSAVVGTATVVSTGYPDPAQFDKKSEYHDPGATRENPRWFVVDVAFEAKFKHPVSLEAIKETPALAEMVLVKRSRLSVQPVTELEWKTLLRLGVPAES
ncbi:MAG: EVE domain-containing protein [Deltaproteobacteria bacterium]|nr:EVE domain-containing protein [Deltaproteobacteria bacterium]